MVLRGVVGRIEWAHYEAARVEGYTVTRTAADGWRLTARVILADPFKLAQRPLRVVAPHARGTWEWPITTITIDAGTLTARLGAPS